MLSYQHGYHAGNRADVLKHSVLHAILEQRSRNPKPLLYIESHAARGQYDLTDRQATKTNEAKLGVLAFPGAQASPPALQPWLRHLKDKLPHNSPGSPRLAVDVLNQQSRFVFFEKHPTEFKALKANLGDDDRILIKKEDGYNGALRLQPRRGEDMIMLLDPSYETASDMEALADWTPRALRKWPKAKILIWLPLFADHREEELGAFLSELDTGFVAGSGWDRTPDDPSALTGSAMIGLRFGGADSRKAFAIAAQLDAYWAQ